MPIKPEDVNSPESLITVNVLERINMDTFFFNSQDSLGLIEEYELFKEPIEQNVIEEIMTTVNSESEELVNDNTTDSKSNLVMSLNEIKHPPGSIDGIISPPTGTIPSQEDFTGPYGFDLNFSGSHSRGSYVYSPLLRQVFIGMNSVLMMEFKTTIQLGDGFYIRALLMYTCDDFICVPVVRCASHALEDDPRQEAHARGVEYICRCPDFKNVGHVIRCSLTEARYCYDIKSERHSVKVPVRRLQAGTDFIQVPYTFSCKTSCPRGMQRKPVQIIFTLENEEGVVCGRKVLPVKICSCPKRDKDRQERDYKKSQQIQSCPSGSKRLAPPPVPSSQNDSQLLPNKMIKVEENDFEYSQNEEDKLKQHRKSSANTQHPTNLEDNEQYQRLLTRLTNVENILETRMNRLENSQRESIERLDRIECLLSDFFCNRQ